MKRNAALVVMGAWLAGSICVSVVATQNFYTIDRLLAERSSPAFTAVVDRLGAPQARELLRYLSSELNRLYFQLWNGAQLVLGALALWLVTDSRHRDAANRRVQSGIVVMLAIVVFMLVYLTPAIVMLGRSLDFVPRDPAPSSLQRFWILHAAFTSLELIKLALGACVAFWIGTRGQSAAALHVSAGPTHGSAPAAPAESEG